MESASGFKFMPISYWESWAEQRNVIPGNDLPYSETSEYESDASDDQGKLVLTRSMGMATKKTIPFDETADFTERVVKKKLTSLLSSSRLISITRLAC